RTTAGSCGGLPGAQSRREGRCEVTEEEMLDRTVVTKVRELKRGDVVASQRSINMASGPTPPEWSCTLRVLDATCSAKGRWLVFLEDLADHVVVGGLTAHRHLRFQDGDVEVQRLERRMAR